MTHLHQKYVLRRHVYMYIALSVCRPVGYLVYVGFNFRNYSVVRKIPPFRQNFT